MEIKNRIALVTGGANGIGYAIGTELLQNGAAHVAILDLPDVNGEGAVSKLNEKFGPRRAIFVICDVTKTEELEAGFAEIVKEFGGLDIVINNAGILNEKRWELMVNVNYNGVIRGTLLGLQYMGKDRGGKGGTIVNIASISGIIPISSFPIYCGTKHAIVGFSRSFARPYHYKKSDVRILTMCPSGTETNLVNDCVGRMLDFIGEEALAEDALEGLGSQTVDCVAKGVMQIIQSGDNGSVWIAENGKPISEIDISAHPTKKVPTKEQR